MRRYNKKGGLAEFYVFLGVIVIIAVIFIASFAVTKFRDLKKDNDVTKKMERLDKELYLLNYLRTPFKDSINYADYIATSNMFLINDMTNEDLYSSYRPDDFDVFMETTIEYFDEALSTEDKRWFLAIIPVDGRNVNDLLTEQGEIKNVDMPRAVYITPIKEASPGLLKSASTAILGTQFIPSPAGKTFIIQLQQISLSKMTQSPYPY